MQSDNPATSRNVLIVDRDQAFSEALASYLSKNGCCVAVALPSEMLKSLAEFKAAIVICDIDGADVLIGGDVLSVANLAPTGQTEIDDSATSVGIVFGNLSKSIYAINGATGYPMPVRVSPNDTVTLTCLRCAEVMTWLRAGLVATGAPPPSSQTGAHPSPSTNAAVKARR